jgi:hypothetical protein
MTRGTYWQHFRIVRKKRLAACLSRREATTILQHFPVLIQGVPDVMLPAVAFVEDFLPGPLVAGWAGCGCALAEVSLPLRHHARIASSRITRPRAARISALGR